MIVHCRRSWKNPALQPTKELDKPIFRCSSYRCGWLNASYRCCCFSLLPVRFGRAYAVVSMTIPNPIRAASPRPAARPRSRQSRVAPRTANRCRALSYRERILNACRQILSIKLSEFCSMSLTPACRLHPGAWRDRSLGRSETITDSSSHALQTLSTCVTIAF